MRSLAWCRRSMAGRHLSMALRRPSITHPRTTPRPGKHITNSSTGRGAPAAGARASTGRAGAGATITAARTSTPGALLSTQVVEPQTTIVVCVPLIPLYFFVGSLCSSPLPCIQARGAQLLLDIKAKNTSSPPRSPVRRHPASAFERPAFTSDSRSSSFDGDVRNRGVSGRKLAQHLDEHLRATATSTNSGLAPARGQAEHVLRFTRGVNSPLRGSSPVHTPPPVVEAEGGYFGAVPRRGVQFGSASPPVGSGHSSPVRSGHSSPLHSGHASPVHSTPSSQSHSPAQPSSPVPSDPDAVYQAFVRQWCFAQGPAPVHGAGGPVVVS